METKNAIIIDTYLGFERSTIFTFKLIIDYGSGSSQMAGNFVLDVYNQNSSGNKMASKLIMEILKVVGADSWEELKNKYIRVKADYDKIYEIGNIMEDKWLNFDGFFNTC